MLRQLKHTMNSGFTEIHRFALPKGATQTAIETRIERGKTYSLTLASPSGRGGTVEDCDGEGKHTHLFNNAH